MDKIYKSQVLNLFVPETSRLEKVKQTEVSLSCSQGPDACHCPEPAQSTGIPCHPWSIVSFRNMPFCNGEELLVPISAL